MDLSNLFGHLKAFSWRQKESDAIRNEQSENEHIASSAFVWALERPPLAITPELGISALPRNIDDSSLVSRVQAAYRGAVSGFQETTSFWDGAISELKQPIHEVLISALPATSTLRNPATNAHFWGFDAVCQAPPGMIEPHEHVLRNLNETLDFKTLYAKWLSDALVSLAEATGARRAFYPETKPGHFYELFGEPADVDLLLDDIEKQIGWPLTFPNPYAGELGLSSKRGIIGFRSLQAIYQAWRLMQLARGRDNFRVVEVGAGLGRTAYFAVQFGIAQYTIIDIPLTGAAQGYFLGRTLGSHQVDLYGEARKGAVRILPPQAINDLNERFDLMLNVDSFTEMSSETMRGYWDFARSGTDGLLTINHELNPYPVNSIYKNDPSVCYSRHPYWMRRGYVEELITWN